MSRTIHLEGASIEFTEHGCTSRFTDGAHIDSIPHDTHHYAVVSHRCGYGDDILAYAQEHDFAHLYMAERVLHRPSILWLVAHKRKPFDGGAQMEEALVQCFQRWLRANEEPIIADCDWHGLKADALRLLG